MQKLRQDLRVCRKEKKEETVMLRKQVIAAWRPCGDNSSRWEGIELRLCSKGAEQWERPRGRCQEEKKEQGKVTTNKSKTKLVSSLASASSGRNEGTPASSLELDLPRVQGAFGECGGAGK